MIYNIVAVCISILIPLLLVIKPIKELIKGNKIKEIFSNYKFELILYIILVFGFLSRLLVINILPNGLNVDEASSGYEAYSILNYGIDRNGNSLPVFLLSWGSGQNALLTYLMIPFVALFGLSELTVRLPLALIGCGSLIVMYYLLKNIFNNKNVAIIGLAFFVICPWHIMKSRWGLESNIFPDMILLSTLLVILSIKNKKDYLMYIAFAIIGLTSYAYGTSYFFLPIYVSITLIYLLIKKQLTIKKAIISFSIAFIIAIPILLFLIINTFDLPQFKILGFTIPRLVVNRYEELSSVFSADFIQNCINNFVTSIKILVVQNDGLPWSQLKGFGLTYLITLPFTIIGLAFAITKYKKQIFNTLMNIWFITSVLLLFVCEPNVNRINIIIIPIIYYSIIGIYEVIKKLPKVKYPIIIAYIICFILFMVIYMNTDFRKYVTFQSDVKEIVEYAENSEYENIYVDYSFKEPYIYFLFYSKYNAKKYGDTVQYFNKNGTFENVKSFGRYKFYLPENFEEGMIIVPKNYKGELDFEKADKKEFERFYVYELGENV